MRVQGGGGNIDFGPRGIIRIRKNQMDKDINNETNTRILKSLAGIAVCEAVAFARRLTRRPDL